MGSCCAQSCAPHFKPVWTYPLLGWCFLPVQGWPWASRRSAPRCCGVRGMHCSAGNPALMAICPFLGRPPPFPAANSGLLPMRNAKAFLPVLLKTFIFFPLREINKSLPITVITFGVKFRLTYELVLYLGN